MALFRTKSGNPVMGEKVMERVSESAYEGRTMTVNGSINKTALLGLLLIASAAVSWNVLLFTHSSAWLMQTVIGGIVASIGIAIALVFRPDWSRVLAPVYAITEGLFIGSISVMFEGMFAGIVMQAVGLTFAVFLVMLGLYRTGVVRATPLFTKVIISATLGVMLFYLVSIVLRLGFGLQIGLIHDSGAFGIGFSLFVVALAAFNLILDFDFIDRGSREGFPAYMEWYAAFAMLVTLVWLYLEILRLLSKLQRD